MMPTEANLHHREHALFLGSDLGPPEPLAIQRMGQRCVAGTERNRDTDGSLSVHCRLMDEGSIDTEHVLGRQREFWLTAFQLPKWCSAWQNVLGSTDGAAPVTAVLSTANRVFAILPLMLVKTKGLRVLTWHAEKQSDYGAPIVKHENLEEFSSTDMKPFLRAIAATAGGADLVFLPKQPEHIGGRTNPFLVGRATSHHCGAHAINFQPGELLDEFLDRQRSRSTRQTLRRKEKALSKLGKVEFRIARTREEALAIAEHCLAAKSRQLARLRHHDPFSSSNVRRFITEFVSTEVNRSTWAVALTLDGKLIASAIGFDTVGEWLLYQMAMDADGLESCSPGTQMLLRIVDHCLKSGIKRLDLGLGDEGYKFDWCDEHIKLTDCYLPLTPLGYLACVVLQAKGQIFRWLATYPGLYSTAKKLKRHVSKMRTAKG